MALFFPPFIVWVVSPKFEAMGGKWAEKAGEETKGQEERSHMAEGKVHSRKGDELVKEKKKKAK